MGKREKVRARQIKKKVVDRQKSRKPFENVGPTRFRGSGQNIARTETSGSHISNQRSASAKCTTYSREDTILVVGDGDFTFSRGLVKHRGTGKDVLATSYDSHKDVAKKYPQAKEVLEKVRASGAEVLHDVDATNLRKTLPARFLQHKFNRIVFNFPHSGEQRVHLNRELLKNFFSSAKTVLQPGGEVHVTLKMRRPYSEWGVEERAREAGMRTARVLQFDYKQFPGYRHQTTKADAKTFVAASNDEARLCKTFVMVPAPNEEQIITAATHSEMQDESEEEEEEEEDEEEEEPALEHPGKGNVPNSKRGRGESDGRGQAADAKRARGAGQAAAAEGDGEGWWTAGRLEELMSELRGMSSKQEDAAGGGWGEAGTKYADATREEEVEDVGAIDSFLDPEEARLLAHQGLPSLLGELGQRLPGNGPAPSQRAQVGDPEPSSGRGYSVVSAQAGEHGKMGTSRKRLYGAQAEADSAAATTREFSVAKDGEAAVRGRGRGGARGLVLALLLRRSCRGGAVLARALARRRRQRP